MREGSVADFYGASGLWDRLFSAIAAAGLDPEHLAPVDLAPVDEFHMGGHAATSEIVGRLGLTSGDRVLDIGSGIGGLVRHLASEIGCAVTGLDLTPEFVEIARELTRRTGLQDRAEFIVGSALALPFPDAAFDAAVTFHAGMNIADRATKYAEAARVLRPGGRFAVYDVLKGPVPGMRFPVPWAETDETSHLVTAAEMHDLLTAAGFEILDAEDRTPLVLELHRALLARGRGAGTPSPLGLHLLLGDNAAEKSANMIAMTEAGQIALGLFIARRPA